ncbi:DUF3800 domain-containing protein [Methanocorpusculum sp.]|nr:DUF3800 domain-containing protein [Methanocorpusculum sp.]
MYVYIDESGILTPGQGDYFLVTAYVVEDMSVASRCLKVIRQNLKKQYKKNGELKYNNSSPDIRRKILTCITKHDFQVYYSAYEKHPLTCSQLHVKGGIFSALLRKVCEDAGCVDAVYIDKFLKKSQEEVFTQYFADILSVDCIRYVDSQRCPGIQVADFLSGTLNQLYNNPDKADADVCYAIIKQNVIKVR